MKKKRERKIIDLILKRYMIAEYSLSASEMAGIIRMGWITFTTGE